MQSPPSPLATDLQKGQCPMATLRNLPAPHKPTRLRVWDESESPVAANPGPTDALKCIVEAIVLTMGEQEARERLLLIGRYQWVYDALALGQQA